jgi:hypothetical protein
MGEVFGQIDDHRQAGKVDFSLYDCLMSALAMMFFQDPSLLSFQRRMQDSMQCINLKTYGVNSTPGDAVLRKTVDDIDTENINPCFSILFQHLQRGKQLLPYKLEIENETFKPSKIKATISNIASATASSSYRITFLC